MHLQKPPGKHFSWSELIGSDTARKIEIDNTPPVHAQLALVNLCSNLLDPLRERLGLPIEVTSGYRCKQLNDAVRGSPTSQHMKGEAADIKVKGFTSEQLALYIGVLVRRGELPIDQCIIYETTKHVHVSLKNDGSTDRGMFLYKPEHGRYTRWTPMLVHEM